MICFIEGILEFFDALVDISGFFFNHAFPLAKIEIIFLKRSELIIFDSVSIIFLHLSAFAHVTYTFQLIDFMEFLDLLLVIVTTVDQDLMILQIPEILLTLLQSGDFLIRGIKDPLDLGSLIFLRALFKVGGGHSLFLKCVAEDEHIELLG